MTISIRYRRRLITVDQEPEGFCFQYDDGRLITAGVEPHPTRQAALLAAIRQIEEEDAAEEGEK
jgi:hypothetical protein